ncbi:branched-chain amino acid ABC transporter permease [Roseitranquillus sediminis]|uniref:branched-chain amino acid ABC transporter permease n=1 Tax=Roseitranquillus sediminis TaxID=2809051 RepID=UPI001D0C79BE|nr:branched-chain amino acid ABC transporter permease [Roseitranquillus sediminis]
MSTRTPASVAAGLMAVVLVGGAVVLPAYASFELLGELSILLTMLVLAQFWNLLAHHAGLVSLGQQAFVGIGAYGLFAAVIAYRLDPLPAILVGGASALVLAIPVAVLALRLGSVQFAIGTWVFAEAVRLGVTQWNAAGGGADLSLPLEAREGMLGADWVGATFDVEAAAARDILVYWSALALAVLTVGFVYRLLRTSGGLGMTAARVDLVTAQSVGVRPARMRWMVFLAAAFGTGVAGALIFLQGARVAPDTAFDMVQWTICVIFIVVIGGLGTIEGPILGVLAFYFLQRALVGYGDWLLAVLSVLAIAFMLFAPRGLWGIVHAATGLQLFPTRRRLVRNRGEVPPKKAAGN